MKKYIFSLMLSFSSILSLSAMSYEAAREQARFLTDKMAYELNLNDQQYNDCYEINLDYLLSVETADQIYGDYLAYRNADLRHILYDWQYTIFAAADYFFRPLAWLHNRWFFPIYRHYHAGYYYYGFPAVYHSYRGGHGRFYHHDGYYVSRRPHWNGGFRGVDRHPMNHHGSVGHSRHDRHDRYNRHDRHDSGRGNGYHIGDGNQRGNSGHSSHDNVGRGNSGHSNHDNVGRGSSRHSSHDNVGRGNSGHSNHDNVSRGNNGGYDHPSSTRTTVHNGLHNGITHSSGSHDRITHKGNIGGGMRSSTRSGSISSISHSGGSHSGGFRGTSRGSSHGGSSHGGGSHSSGSHGGGSHGGHGGGRGR